MAKRRTSADIAAELKVLQDELVALSDVDGTEEEVQRALDKSNDMLVRFDELKVEHAEAVDYEKKVEAVRALALSPGNRDGADKDGKYLGDKGPEFKPKTDPFDEDPTRLPKADVISRAMTFVDSEKRVPISDRNREHLEHLVHRSSDDEGDDAQFDGSYVARRMLLTEHTAYRSAFRKYCRLGTMAQYNSEEQKAISQFQDYEIRRAASENTTTAGGFGVPVKVAA